MLSGVDVDRLKRAAATLEFVNDRSELDRLRASSEYRENFAWPSHIAATDVPAPDVERKVLQGTPSRRRTGRLRVMPRLLQRVQGLSLR